MREIYYYYFYTDEPKEDLLSDMDKGNVESEKRSYFEKDYMESSLLLRTFYSDSKERLIETVTKYIQEMDNDL